MSPEFFGILSGALVAASAVPYGIRTWQRKIRPNITTWVLWSVIGFALLLTYRDSGAGWNVWPAVFGFINPCILTYIAIKRRGDLEPLTIWEKSSVVGCLTSLALWWAVKDNKEMAQYALYLAIFADLCAAIPTIILVWTKPEEDRPGAWSIFAVAYGLGIFAITEHSFSNYILPLYMFFGSLTIVVPLFIHRIRMGTPIAQWV